MSNILKAFFKIISEPIIKHAKKILLVIFAVICLAGCDLITKNMATENLKGSQVKSYLGGNIELVFTENSGGMLSLGSKLPKQVKFIIFQLCISILLSALFFYIILKENLGKLQGIALILVLSGGLGNLITRIGNDGKVIDFIVVELFGYHSGIFNIADIYVTIGVVILIVSSIYLKYRPKKSTV